MTWPRKGGWGFSGNLPEKIHGFVIDDNFEESSRRGDERALRGRLSVDALRGDPSISLSIADRSLRALGVETTLFIFSS